jgi:hypothetical protein
VVAKTLLLQFTAKSANFRVADTEPPLEEVSVVGKGRFGGKELTCLYTVRIVPTGKSKDRQEGAGILYLEGHGRATFRVAGALSSTPRWRERVAGTMSFGNDCTGEFEKLKNTRVSYQTLVNAKGKSTTKVWK